jgi:hypothetical protein
MHTPTLEFGIEMSVPLNQGVSEVAALLVAQLKAWLRRGKGDVSTRGSHTSMCLASSYTQRLNPFYLSKGTQGILTSRGLCALMHTGSGGALEA